MKKTLLLIGVFALGFIMGQANDQKLLLPLTRMSLYEKLSSELTQKYPISEDDIGQGRHVAAGYQYGTCDDVRRWYYSMKWKYAGNNN